MLAYRALRSFLRLGVRIFFRRIEVVGLEHIPAEGPVVFCGNHPNSLLDPILITCFCGRVVHFAAKDVLFRSRVLRFFLSVMGAVPVRRRTDHGGDSVSNDDAFDALFAVLGAGRTMGIFPEGLSHDEAQLSRLKTGAARIAFGAERSRGWDLGVRLVPCGLTYVHPKRFRSSVLIQFGAPLTVGESERGAFEADERAACRALTDDLELGLRGLTINAQDWDTVRVLDGVRRLYQPPRIALAARVELSRRFNEVYPTVAHQPAARALFAQVHGYLLRLRELGLTDAELSRPVRPGQAVLRVLHYLTVLLVWGPLSLIGGPLHVPMALLFGWAGQALSPRKDVVATTKFMLGFLLMNALYVGGAALAGWLAGWQWGLVVLFGVPLSGYATLRVIERGMAVRGAWKTLARLFFLRREVQAMRQERVALLAAVHRAVDAFIPEDMERMYPSKTPDP